MIFSPSITLADLNRHSKNSLAEHLGIVYTAIKSNYIQAKMFIDKKTRQPMGILHGGASLALAETLGSMAANCAVDQKKYYCLGMEINANHVRPAPEGTYVYATTLPLHMGKTTHVWEIKINNNNKQLICIARHTVAVRSKKLL